MQRISILLLTLLFALTGWAQGSNSVSGILMVHYGTRNDASRAATVDRLNALVAERFPQSKVVEAYVAPAVIKALAKRGIVKPTVSQALDSLRNMGCRRVVVQSTMLLDGNMTDVLQAALDRKRADFEQIEVGKPLLWSVDDCRSMAAMIARHLGNSAGKAQVVLVGHGSDNAANAMYSQMDYMLQDEGHAQWHVGTIEGYPTRECVERRLQASHQKQVVLVPLLYIAGNHLREDIDGVWRKALETKGYNVNVVKEGLGEMKEIQELILDRIKTMLDNQTKHK